jgi:hypothetical protein
MMEVNSFWHGTDFTNLELLCISSFLKNGVNYNLYVYERPSNLPDGVTVRNAGEIVPRERLFTYQAGTFNLGSVSGFSNLFRFTLIHELGGWWSDTDVCYVNGFADERPQVFFAEPSQGGEFRTGTAVFKGSPGSPVLRYCLDRFAEKDPTKIVHGETGPSLLTEAILASQAESEVEESALVFPVPWWEYQRLFWDEELSVEESSAVHFWNAMLRSSQIDKNGAFPPRTAFERLKRKYL